MKHTMDRVRRYMYDQTIDLNERLSYFFVAIGIVAALLGVLICLLSHTSVWGTMATGAIALGAPLLVSLSQHFKWLRRRFGNAIAVGIAVLIPVVWLQSGGTTGGVSIWFVYELFYMALFTTPKKLPVYLVPALLLQGACFAVEALRPEWVFQYATQADRYISIIGSIVVVSTTIIATVIVQKDLYMHERRLRDRTEDYVEEFVTSVAAMIDAKDSDTGSHSKRVAQCSADLARRLGMTEDEAANIYTVGLLHDIGKLAVPDNILTKPGRLTDEEYAMIRRHPAVGGELLAGLESIAHVKEGTLYHHERYDGGGYPFGLAGEETPLFARIICVADSYDAMSTTRVYQRKRSREDIIGEFRRCRGRQFDPWVTDVFVRMLEEGYTVREDAEITA